MTDQCACRRGNQPCDRPHTRIEPATCYRDDEGWWCIDRHLEHPEDYTGTCAGCQPCGEHHCLVCRDATHVDSREVQACPKCVGKTRGRLHAIEARTAELLDEAIVKGVNSEAANLAGPVADPEAWMWHRLAATDRLAELPVEPDQHPLTVLGTWDFMLREDYDQPTDARATLPAVVDYLTGLLTRFSRDPGQDFVLFDREVRTCLAHLETVLGDSRRAEKGAPCPTCRESRKDTDPAAPKLALRRNEDDITGALDRWVCPHDDRHWWSEADYRMRVGNDYLEHAEVLTASQIHTVYRVPEGTVRRWANGWTSHGVDYPPCVAKRGYDGQRRQLYDVADVKLMRDTQTPVSRAS